MTFSSSLIVHKDLVEPFLLNFYHTLFIVRQPYWPYLSCRTKNWRLTRHLKPYNIVKDFIGLNPIQIQLCVMLREQIRFLIRFIEWKTLSLLLVEIIMSTNTEVLCGLGPWRPSFLQPLASKKVYLFFYGCLGIIQGMFFTYLRLIELIRLKLPNIRHMNDHRGPIVGQFRIYQRIDQTPNRLKILHSG